MDDLASSDLHWKFLNSITNHWKKYTHDILMIWKDWQHQSLTQKMTVLPSGFSFLNRKWSLSRQKQIIGDFMH